MEKKVVFAFFFLILCGIFVSSFEVEKKPMKLNKLAKLNREVLGVRTVGPKTWGECVNLTKEIGAVVCLDVEVIPANLSLIVSLTFNNKTIWHDEFEASRVCLDDATLLELLSDLPVLAPYKPIIDKIIDVMGFIPAEILSICVFAENLNITSTRAIADWYIDFTILCLDLMQQPLKVSEEHCLYNHTDFLGHMDLNY